MRSVRDHYPEKMLYEEIVRLLKGATADLLCYLGPQTPVVNILVKLNFLYGMVAPFNILML